MNIFDREHEAILQTYKRLPIAVASAKGCKIISQDGDEYLDFLAGIAVNTLGHSHPKIIEAVYEQVKKFMHVSNYFFQEPQVLLAEKLKEISGIDKVFFTNSGTEAIEGAMKLVRRWGKQNGKSEIVGFTGGFHGRTYGALSIMDKPLYKADMGPFLGETKILPYNDIIALEKGLNENIAAVFLEFIQGEGGISVVSREFCQKLNELRKKYGFLVIADEVQAGTGRTGKFFAFQHFSFELDIIIMAKGIGGGLPLGAFLVNQKLSTVFEKGMHGTTYGGNAVACAAGLVVIDEIQNGLEEHVNEVSSYFINRLKEVQKQFPVKILEIRGKGLMLGLLLSFDASILVNEMLKRKIITNAASGIVLRIIPPLIISKEEIDIFIRSLIESLDVIND